jgi:hypothetical protein
MSDYDQRSQNVNHQINADSVEGITGEELVEIIRTLQEYSPKYLLKFNKTLRELRRCHKELGEYKELHNKINDILTRFEPFKNATIRLKSNEIERRLESLKTHWQLVSLGVDELLKWAGRIDHIGERFQIVEGKQKRGESWAVQFSQLQDEINQLGLEIVYTEKMVYPDQRQTPSFEFSMDKNLWVSRLRSCTERFNNITLVYMSDTDKKLLNTAQRLLSISDKALSNY